jgi:CelD/BcsL family acetyltransferase involved in cellulose biosynthesis
MSAPRHAVPAEGFDPAALRPAWLDLWRRCAGDPFQHPDWIAAWWEIFAPGPPAVAAVWQGAALAALAPLYRDPASGLVLPMGVGPSDRTDVLVDPAAPRAGARLAAAIDAAAGASGVLWPDVPPGATVLALPPPPTRRAMTAPGAPSAVIDLARGLAAVPAPRWRKWRMAGHRASRRGALDVVDASCFGLDAFAARLVALNGARFRPEDGGVFADARLADFVRRAVPALAAAGLLDAHVALVGGAVAGAHCGFRAAGRAYAWLGGFDPAFARESPGTLLLGEAVRRAAARGDRAFDLLRGEEPYKFGWGATPTRLVRLAWSAPDHG